MIELGLPLMLLLLPLPLLVRWLLPAAPEGRGGALRVPFYAALGALPSGAGGEGRRGRTALVLKSLAWIFLVLAATQPRWLGEPRAVTSHGRDLMLALDLSGSMAIEDFDVAGRQVDRLRVVNAVAREFVQNRSGDRVGLVLFGSRAYLQAPLTFDRTTVVGMLDEAAIGLAGEETAIGDAIGLAVKHLRDRPAEERVLVLLSDGANNAGMLEPLEAAELAAENDVRIYSIGIGSGEQTIQTLFGPQTISGGELDEATLARIAALTGGDYFRARDTQGLVEIYRRIDVLEPTEGEAAMLRPRRELFCWPLGAAFAIATLLLAQRIAADSGVLTQRLSKDGGKGR